MLNIGLTMTIPDAARLLCATTHLRDGSENNLDVVLVCLTFSDNTFVTSHRDCYLVFYRNQANRLAEKVLPGVPEFTDHGAENHLPIHVRKVEGVRVRHGGNVSEFLTAIFGEEEFRLSTRL